MYVAGGMILVKQNVDHNTCPDLVARSVESIRFVSSEQSGPWTFIWNLHAELQVIEHCLWMLLEWSFEKILLSSDWLVLRIQVWWPKDVKTRE